jgi:hypothetical protein
MNDLQRYADDLAVRQGYLDYDVCDGKIDAGWAHPVVLQMLAHLRCIELYIWRLGDDGQLLPHDLYHHYQPSNATQQTDLLFVNNNHFERLEKLDYAQPSKLKNEEMFESLNKQENTPQLDYNLPPSVLITANHIKEMLQRVTRPPQPTTPQQRYQQTLELLIQFGERLKQCCSFEELKASVVVKRPLEFVLDKKLSYLSGYVLQAASLLVTNNDKNLVPWLAAVGTLIGSTGYSIFKTLEVTRSNYRDIQ